MLVGLFEPEGGTVVPRHDPAGPRVRGAAAGLGSDGRVPVRRDGPVPVAARRRDPAVLLRAGELHLGQRSAARRGARAPRVLRRVRAELARHPAVRRRGLVRSRSGSSTANRRSTSRGSRWTGSMPFMATRAFREQKTVELLGHAVRRRRVPVVAAVDRARDSRGRVIHDRLADAGADFVVLTGYEVPEWFAAKGCQPRATAGVGCATSRSMRRQTNTRAVREAVGDDGHVVHGEAHGAGAGRAQHCSTA